MDLKKKQQKTYFFSSIYRFLFSDYLFKKEQVNKKHVYHIMQGEELKTCIFASIIVFFVELVFLIQDLVVTRQTFDKLYLYLIPEFTLIIYSIFFVSVAKFIIPTKKYKLKRALCFLFYLFVVMSAMFSVLGNLLEDPNSFSFSVLFLMIIVIAPSTFFLDNIILFILELSGITTVLLISNTTTSFYPYYLFVGLFIVFSLYYRSNLVKSYIYRVKEQDLHEVIKIQTYTDTLTCALNRRALEEILSDNFDDWKKSKEDVALIMFDIDNFKEYNDNFSHLTGDEVLKLVASTSSQLCNSNMPNIFRYGGDEFLMVVVGCDRLDVLTKSIDLLRSAAKLKINRVRNQELYMTISVGVCMLNNKIDSPSEFISSVDEELYYAKNNGKACVAFEKKIYR